MNYLSIYKDLLGCSNPDDVFEYLISNLKPSTLIWSYFVNWDKVFNNIKDIEIDLNTLNYLIGKENFDEEFKYLIKKQPSLAQVLPLLVVRDGSSSRKFKILVDYSNKKLSYKDYDFTKKNPTDEDINNYLEFLQHTGFKDLICCKKIKNLVDYMIGVEAGLDSNARKNRGGTIMEDIVEAFISDLCQRNNYSYLKEANAELIKQRYGYDVPVDKSSRRYDFVINTNKELVIIEVNFYSGGGSKLKATAGEYKGLYNVLKDKYKFIWITDGLGWKTCTRPLRETFDNNDYLVNLDMIEKGFLEKILNLNLI